MQHIVSIFEFRRPGEVQTVLDMAWLYMLAYPYDGQGLTFKSWQNDRRMFGVKASDAMRRLVGQGYAVEKPDKWLATKAGVDAVNKEFGCNSEDDALTAAKALGQFDPKRGDLYGYQISKIPMEMYRTNLKKSRSKNLKKTLSDHDYEVITKVLARYQRDDMHESSLARLKKYVGMVDELCENKEYVLYRGVNFRPEDIARKLKAGMQMESGVSDIQSWTTSKSIAVQFALGNPTPMEVKIDVNRFKGYKGVVFKHTFKPQDVVLDFVYVDDANPDLEDAIYWTEECEVLVLAGADSQFEILEVHDEQGKVSARFA